MLPSVSCPSKACDWTIGSHSNSNQLINKCVWGVACCIVFMATNGVTEHVVYASDACWCRASGQSRLNCCVHSSSMRRAVAVMRRRKCPINSTLRRSANRDICANNRERRRRQLHRRRTGKEEGGRERKEREGRRVRARGRGERKGGRGSGTKG